MSVECGECERDLRGGHDPSCSRHPKNKKPPEVTSHDAILVLNMVQRLEAWKPGWIRQAVTSEERDMVRKLEKIFDIRLNQAHHNIKALL